MNQQANTQIDWSQRNAVEQNLTADSLVNRHTLSRAFNLTLNQVSALIKDVKPVKRKGIIKFYRLGDVDRFMNETLMFSTELAIYFDQPITTIGVALDGVAWDDSTTETDHKGTRVIGKRWRVGVVRQKLIDLGYSNDTTS